MLLSSSLLTRQAHVAGYYSQKPYALRRMTEALPENLLGSWIKTIMAGTAHGELEIFEVRVHTWWHWSDFE